MGAGFPTFLFHTMVVKNYPYNLSTWDLLIANSKIFKHVSNIAFYRSEPLAISRGREHLRCYIVGKPEIFHRICDSPYTPLAAGLIALVGAGLMK